MQNPRSRKDCITPNFRNALILSCRANATGSALRRQRQRAVTFSLSFHRSGRPIGIRPTDRRGDGPQNTFDRRPVTPGNRFTTQFFARIRPAIKSTAGYDRRARNNASSRHLPLQPAAAKGRLGRSKTQITRTFPFHDADGFTTQFFARIRPAIKSTAGYDRRARNNASSRHLPLQPAAAKGRLGRSKTQITRTFPFHDADGTPLETMRSR
jgi:hypothetical protein